MPRGTGERLALLAPSPDLVGGGPAPFVPQAFSVDFDGSTEKLESASSVLGFADTWTVAGWYKISNTLSRQDTLWSFEGGASGNNFRLFQRSNLGTPPSMQVFNATTNTVWQAVPLTAGVWAHIVLIWDTNAFMHLWIDGVDQGSQVAGSEVMADDARTIAIAEASTGVASFLGRCASLAFWNTRLADLEVPAIYNAGSINFDLQTDQGNYASAASIKHWYEVGKRAAPDIGKDTVGSLDLIPTAIDDTDRFADVP